MNFDETRCAELLEAAVARFQRDQAAGKPTIVEPTIKAIMYGMHRVDCAQLAAFAQEIGYFSPEEAETFNNRTKMILQLFSPDCFQPGRAESKEFSSVLDSFTRDMIDIRKSGGSYD
jgi:hypothetical protein